MLSSASLCVVPGQGEVCVCVCLRLLFACFQGFMLVFEVLSAIPTQPTVIGSLQFKSIHTHFVFLNSRWLSGYIWCKSLKDAHPRTHCCQIRLPPPQKSSSFHLTLEVDQKVLQSSASSDHEQWTDVDQSDCVEEVASPVYILRVHQTTQV